MKVVIIDYGMGNIRSVKGALNFLGAHNILVSNQLTDILDADKLILPGVGSFAQAIENIHKAELDKILTEAVLERETSILGICLGMQLMTQGSEEGAVNKGLKFVEGSVEKFNLNDLKVPHVGFNQVSKNTNASLYQGIEDRSDFYFTHSFQMQSKVDINASICDYGNEFIASYEQQNIAGVQFHPELSQTNGLKLLDNFLKNFRC